MTPLTAQFDAAQRSFQTIDADRPRIDPGEILIRVTCCTICGSDLHTYCGRRSAPANCVLGHEIIGLVESWYGDAPPQDFYGNPLDIGQRVTWVMAVGCGRCFYCHNNLPQKCETLFKYGHAVGTDGKPRGGLSTYCVLVPGTAVFPVPDELSDQEACPANCASATVSAAMRLARQTHQIDGADVLIVGAGMLGLTAAAQASDAGAGRVIVVDPDPQRVEIARRFGATDTLVTSKHLARESLRTQLSLDRGVDIALEFSGSNTGVETAIASVRIGGCVLLAGSVFPSDDIAISPESIVRGMITLRGLHNYVPGDLAYSLSFLQRTRSRFPFKSLVGPTFSLSEVSQAFSYARTERPIRVCVRSD